MVAKLKWEMAETQPGDVIFFDSFVPHRSGPNLTDTNRRIMYMTYGKKSEGDWRDRYYTEKFKNLPPDIHRDPAKEYKYKI